MFVLNICLVEFRSQKAVPIIRQWVMCMTPSVNALNSDDKFKNSQEECVKSHLHIHN